MKVHTIFFYMHLPGVAQLNLLLQKNACDPICKLLIHYWGILKKSHWVAINLFAETNV